MNSGRFAVLIRRAGTRGGGQGGAGIIGGDLIQRGSWPQGADMGCLTLGWQMITLYHGLQFVHGISHTVLEDL